MASEQVAASREVRTEQTWSCSKIASDDAEEMNRLTSTSYKILSRAFRTSTVFKGMNPHAELGRYDQCNVIGDALVVPAYGLMRTSTRAMLTELITKVHPACDFETVSMPGTAETAYFRVPLDVARIKPVDERNRLDRFFDDVATASNLYWLLFSILFLACAIYVTFRMSTEDKSKYARTAFDWLAASLSNGKTTSPINQPEPGSGGISP